MISLIVFNNHFYFWNPTVALYEDLTDDIALMRLAKTVTQHQTQARVCQRCWLRNRHGE